MILKPHEAVPQNNSKPPHIYLTPAAAGDIESIIAYSGTSEVGWMGIAKKVDPCHYLITVPTFVPKQEVSAAECEISEEGIGEAWEELLSTNPELYSDMKFWGHVHPGNGTSPSAQDNAQTKVFEQALLAGLGDDPDKFLIRGIFGRLGRAEFSLFDYCTGVIWTDLPWSIFCERPKRTEHWKQKIALNVTETVYPHYQEYQGIYGHSYYKGKHNKKFEKRIRTHSPATPAI